VLSFVTRISDGRVVIMNGTPGNARIVPGISTRAGFALLVLVIAAVAAGCSQEASQEQAVQTRAGGEQFTAPPAATVEKRDNALVRAVNAIPEGPRADVFVGDTKVFDAVDYKTVTPYREVADDWYAIRVHAAGDDAANALAEERQNLLGGRHYTVVAMPGKSPGPTMIQVLDDNLTPPPTGKARVRIVHAALDAPDVDVYGPGDEDAMFGGVSFSTATTYHDVDPMTGVLHVCAKGSKTPVLEISDAKFEAGKHYTIVVVGDSDGLEAIRVEDQLVGTPVRPS
jgi:hypothetical protein